MTSLYAVIRHQWEIPTWHNQWKQRPCLEDADQPYKSNISWTGFLVPWLWDQKRLYLLSLKQITQFSIGDTASSIFWLLACLVHASCAYTKNLIKSLLLSHHHSTCALVSEILESVLHTVQKQLTYRQYHYILTDLYRWLCNIHIHILSTSGVPWGSSQGLQ